ncbi:MAG TPA: S1 family peptidase [Mycobacteriales bacterium]|nr:S1 family peptidase [Mycobacteriales bacterium]
MRARVLAAIVAVVAVLPVAAHATNGSHSVRAASRQSRTSDVAIAGASIFLWSSHGREGKGNGCTLAFSVRSVRTGSRGALTAGHCVAMLDGGPAYRVHQTRSLPPDGTAPGDRLGKVTRTKFVLGPQGDSAYVALRAGRTARPLLFTGGADSRSAIPVAGVKSPRTGMQICYSGAATGEHCGFTVRGGSQTVSFKSGHDRVTIGHEWHADGAACTSRKGDSGSPVYTYDGGVAYAVGILSGGQVRPGRCPFYFTPVRAALREFGLTLLSSRATR